MTILRILNKIISSSYVSSQVSHKCLLDEMWLYVSEYLFYINIEYCIGIFFSEGLRRSHGGSR